MVVFYNECREGAAPMYYLKHRYNPLLSAVFSDKEDLEDCKKVEKVVYGDRPYTSGELKDFKGAYEIVESVYVGNAEVRGFKVDSEALGDLLPKRLR